MRFRLVLLPIAWLATAAAMPLPPGEWTLAARARYEHAEQQTLPQASDAYTLHSELRWHSPRWHGLGARLGLESIDALHARDYHDGYNGQNDRPLIADPESREIDQAYLSWQPRPALDLRAGRQWLHYDSQRFIGGGPAWRQNNQSYDALSLRASPLEHMEIQAAQVWTIHRPAGRRSPVGREETDSQLLHLSVLHPRWGRASAYGYWLDFEDGGAFPATASTRTTGLAWDGGPSLGALRLRLHAEAASQAPHAGGRETNRAHYHLLRAGLEHARGLVQIEHERLGGDGDHGFSTPLAALHAVNGWADRFVQTPRDGLRDVSLLVGWRHGPWQARAAYHDYRADAGDDRYGDEWNLLLTRKLPFGAAFTLKYADYQGRDSAQMLARNPLQAQDLERVWVQIEWSGSLTRP